MPWPRKLFICTISLTFVVVTRRNAQFTEYSRREFSTWWNRRTGPSKRQPLLCNFNRAIVSTKQIFSATKLLNCMNWVGGWRFYALIRQNWTRFMAFYARSRAHFVSQFWNSKFPETESRVALNSILFVYIKSSLAQLPQIYLPGLLISLIFSLCKFFAFSWNTAQMNWTGLS